LINNPPVAKAGPDKKAIVGEVVNFDGSGSSDTDGTIEAYDWDFGDGNTGNGMTVTHVYNMEGTYDVSLAVTDDKDATGTDAVVVIIITPTQAINELMTIVGGMGLHKGTANSLIAKLENAIKALTNGQDHITVNNLNAFINEVEAQKGKKISQVQADELVGYADRIISVINTSAAPAKPLLLSPYNKAHITWGKMKS